MLLVHKDLSWLQVFGELLCIGVRLDGVHLLDLLILLKPLLQLLQLLVQQVFLGLLPCLNILMLIDVLLSESGSLDHIGLGLIDDFLF